MGRLTTSATVLPLLFALAACQGGDPGSLASSQTERALYERIVSSSVECSDNADLLRLVVARGHGGVPVLLIELDGFGFQLEDIELTAAEVKNGYTYRGWLYFADSMSYRFNSRRNARIDWDGWDDWRTPKNGEPGSSFGHLVYERNGEWGYQRHGDMFFGGPRFLKQILGDQRGAETNIDLCEI